MYRRSMRLSLSLASSALVALLTAACDESPPPNTDAGSSPEAGGPRDDASGADSGDAGGTSSESADASTDAGGQPTGTRPHPLYPALDLAALPGAGGGAIGPYEPPALPVTTRSVTVSSTGQQAARDLVDACQTSGTAVTVPDGAGALGGVDLGNLEDCDITLGSQVVLNYLFVGHLPGPTVAPVHRVRLRGGQLGSIMVDPGSSDIVFDGVVLNNAVVPPAQRSGTGIYLPEASDAQGQITAVTERFAFLNSILRMLPDASGGSGCAFLAGDARNVIFANNNIVTASNNNAWGFRLSGGHNYILIDNTVRVAHHKLVRMNDRPVDYVYIKGGLWMREDSVPGFNDSFAQLGEAGTDHIYIHDTAVYLLPTLQVAFGAWSGPGQAGKTWEARRIAWHAKSASVISDAILQAYASSCDPNATCDYGLGTHSYDYDPNLALPADPWRALPALAEDNPDRLPVAP